MASAVIGALRVVLGLDSAAFSTGLAAASGRLGAFGTRATAIASTLTKLGAAAVTAGAAFATALTVSSMNAIDVQSKLARQLGGSVASIQALERAADLAGVSSETLAGAMSRLNARLGETARTGSGPAFEALQRLGLAASDLTGIGIAERMALLGDRMKEAGYSAVQMADTLRQLGIRQSEIIALIEDGGDAIRAAADEVRGYGVAVSDIEARQIEQANDAWSNIGFTLKGIGNQIAIRVAPIIEGLAKAFGSSAQAAGGFGDAISAVLDRVVTVIGWIADRIHQIGFLFKFVELGINGVMLGLAKVGDWFGDNTAGVEYYSGRVADLTAELDNLQANGLPSERLGEWVAEVRAASEETARAAQMTARFAAVFGGPAPIDGLQEFIDGLQTREEAERASQDERLAQLAQFVATGQMTEAEAAAARVRIEQQYNEAVAGLRRDNTENQQRELEQRIENEKTAAEKITAQLAEAEAKRLELRQQSVSAIADIMGSISQIIGDHSERAFKIAKAFAIGEALINTAQAVTKALAGPFPFINAARVGAAGLAQVMAIRRQQPGGGSTTPVPSGGGGATGGGSEAPAAGTGAPQQVLTIRGIKPGDLFSGDAMRNLADQLLQAQRQGVRVIIE